MVSQELLDILRCPADVRNGPDAGLLDLVNGAWLVCRDCGRKYPIKNDIPIMLIEEGDKYRNTPVEKLEAPQ
ncbi:MAG: Trm112 family protein [Chloroflexi bacterium]|nr:Trm112 family protein [Chloroflexota bacterium]